MSCPDLISVIIPTYNYAHFLPEAIQSVFRQEKVVCEVIVVDDGSTDGTADVLERYSGKITVITQENKGLSAARNAGLRKAGGRYIVFLDADDLLLQQALRSQLLVLQGDPQRTMAVCRSLFFETCDAQGQPQPTGSWRLFRDTLEAHLCHFNIAPPHAFMVRRDAVERCGGFDTGLAACEDYDLWFRLAVAGPAPAPNPAGMVAYRRHRGSMSQNLDRQWAHDALLHRHVADVLFQTGFPASARQEGLFGCLAGCLLTYGRLESRQSGLAASLLDPIAAMADCLVREPSRSKRMSETAEYFVLRIATMLRQACGAGRVFDRPIRDLLQRLFPDSMAALNAMPDQDIQGRLEQVTTKLVFAPLEKDSGH